MKVLFSTVFHDYNKRNRGMSFEYYNFLSTLQHMPNIDLVPFDCTDFGEPELKEKNNALVIKTVEKERPDIMFCVAFPEQYTPQTLNYIKNNTGTVTVNWFCDDQWRFDHSTKQDRDNSTKVLCWHFDYSVTTDHEAINKYHKNGYKNVILSQWGANPIQYPKLELPYKFNASFVGQPHGDRRELMTELKENGIKVDCFGFGWKNTGFKKRWNKRFAKHPFLQFDNGRISHEQMIRVFNQSRINLNLSASSDTNSPDQIKGRNFEVPCCGGFLLTKMVPHLQEYYEIGKEVECYDSNGEMMDKIKYYLSHDKERENIALAGHERTLRDHTYEKRFTDIFNQIELKK